MSSDEIDRKLLQAVRDRNFERVKGAFEAGGNVNGPREQRLPPIAAAVTAKHATIVEFLLEQGADPDKPVTSGVPGERALHIAAKTEQVEIVRLLLKRSSADANAIDNRGRTPLMVTCVRPHFCMAVVRLLLEAGADPALADKDGCIPLHGVASRGHTDLVDMLYSTAPATLNLYTSDHETPLFMACSHGHENMVSKLLSLGAMQRPMDETPTGPLLVAVAKGFMGVVRVLINEGGIAAVGGCVALVRALSSSVITHRARILQLLLTVGGEEAVSVLANASFQGRCLLHYGAGFCSTAAVSVLLEAGAGEEARDKEGRIPLDVVGADLGRKYASQRDQGEGVAIRRMLQRGPAYRARSWAWPSNEEEADAGGSDDGGTAAAAAAAAAATATAAVLSSSPAAKPPSIVGVRSVHQKENSSSKLFVKIVGRYCAKD